MNNLLDKHNRDMKTCQNRNIVVYILEDDLSNLFLLKRKLSYYKLFSLFLFADKKEFFDNLNEKLPDIILLDLNLGKSSLDGLSILRQLKELNLTDKIPIIVITGDISSESFVSAFQLGAIDYIKKPYDDLELVARIKRFYNLFSKFKNLDKE